MNVCRICFESDGELFHPCKCSGTIKYVHTDCVLKWLDLRIEEGCKCELCKEPFLLKYDKPLEKDILTAPSRSYLLINPTWHVVSQCLIVIVLQKCVKLSQTEASYLIAHITYQSLYLVLCSLYVYYSIKQKERYLAYLMRNYNSALIFVHIILLFITIVLYIDRFYNAFIILATTNQCYLVVYPIMHTNILSKINKERTIILKNRTD
jgi:RING-variant domain